MFYHVMHLPTPTPTPKLQGVHRKATGVSSSRGIRSQLPHRNDHPSLAVMPSKYRKAQIQVASHFVPQIWKPSNTDYYRLDLLDGSF